MYEMFLPSILLHNFLVNNNNIMSFVYTIGVLVFAIKWYWLDLLENYTKDVIDILQIHCHTKLLSYYNENISC